MKMQFQTTQSHADPDVIDFGLGHPGDELLPRAILQEAAALRLAQTDASLLQYGWEQGDGYFRHALANFLSSRYHVPVEMEHLFVSAGASQALDLICTLYTQPGDVIFVEEPTYFLALRIFADHRLTVVPAPTDADGLDVDALEEALQRHRPVLLYTIPTHQNPAGFTLPLERRQRLVELAEAHDFLIVADEVYHLLSYDAAPPPPLASFAATGRVLGLGSFSKILAPGLRLGWIQAAPQHMHRLSTSGLLDSGGGLNPFTSGLVRVVLEQGWQDAYLNHLHEVYRQRIDALDSALQEHFEGVVDYARPTGGYFFWLRLPETVDAENLLRAALAHKVGFRPGVRFSGCGDLRNCLRISFAYYAPELLQEGVLRLKRSLESAYPEL
ncbi:aminotransferase-like domain-containing protein [Caldilinea sp.]|jgi:DNA-binding transcriptional MocR family regulator|uniref:aminotransferase-like domain-containing protein n=1 Tax=Caldilinea sp. TaxID=2293560 RepID=UPI0021DE9A04|nr:PLP-dependent aminotransferase family protein [Caldilinea sp.]GIV67637.1 MAG: aminotransferase [Caldilinea sp.]